MDERPLQFSVFDEQFVAAARGISPRAGPMENDRALFSVGRFQPERNAERLVPCEIAEGQIDRVVAGEFHCTSDATGGQFVLTAQGCWHCGID